MRLPCISLLLMMICFCAISYGQRQSLSGTLMFRNKTKNADEALSIGEEELPKYTVTSNTIKPSAHVSLQAESTRRTKQGKLYYDTLNLIVGNI